MPKNDESFKPLIEHPNVYLDACNMENKTPFEILKNAETHSRSKKVRILRKLHDRFGEADLEEWMLAIITNNTKTDNDNMKQEMQDSGRKGSETHMLVAALIATVIFMAGFTLPRGYDGNEGPNQGFCRVVRDDADAIIRERFPVTRLVICDQYGSQIINELGTNQWPVPPGTRSLRCTGVALSVAEGLLGACMAGLVQGLLHQ